MAVYLIERDLQKSPFTRSDKFSAEDVGNWLNTVKDSREEFRTTVINFKDLMEPYYRSVSAILNEKPSGLAYDLASDKAKEQVTQFIKSSAIEIVSDCNMIIEYLSKFEQVGDDING